MADQTRLSRLIGVSGLVVGAWLLLSPVILDYHSFNAIAQQTVIGSVIMLVAGVRIALPEIHWPSWIALLLSIELIIMPLTLAPIGLAAHWNTTVTGLTLLGLSGYSLALRRVKHHPDHYIPTFR